jgi:hypothetical protein
VKLCAETVIGRFKAYFEKQKSWRSLSMVLEEFNTEDRNVGHCIKRAIESGDSEGERLGKLLLELSRSERRKISRLVEEECLLN